MKYDFETVQNRTKYGASKWVSMEMALGHVPENVIPMSVADMELKNPQPILDAIKKTIEEVPLGYYGPTDRYFDSVINWMKRRHNLVITKDDLVNMPGIVPSLYVAVRSFTKENDGVIIFSPVYHCFKNSIVENNRTVVNCPLIIENDSYKIDFDLFEQLSQKPENKLLILCSPHNPSGVVWTLDELQKITDICKRNNVIIICDEIHHDLVMEGYKHIPFPNVSKEARDISITLTAPNKTFNIAAFGGGNAIIFNEEIKEKFKAGLKQDGYGFYNVLAYEAHIAGYNECEDWVDEYIKFTKGQYDVVKEFFNTNYPDAIVYKMPSSYLAWIDFRNVKHSYNSFDELFKDCMFFANDGKMYGTQGEGYIRINLALPRQNLIDNLNRFKEKV